MYKYYAQTVEIYVFEVYRNNENVAKARLLVIKKDSTHNGATSEKYGFLDQLWVAEISRPNSVLKQLFIEIVEKARQLYCYKLVVVQTEVSKFSLETFTKAGFEIVGTGLSYDL
jgi:N-acetylglutamate synthase-like GNAT family acetyltransferase